MQLIIKLIVNALAIFITAQLLSEVRVDDLMTALILAIVLSLINTFLRPVLLFFTLPINILTMGLFTFVLNAFLILLASYLVDGFFVPSFWWALGFSLVLTIMNSVLLWIVK